MTKDEGCHKIKAIAQHRRGQGELLLPILCSDLCLPHFRLWTINKAVERWIYILQALWEMAEYDMI